MGVRYVDGSQVTASRSEGAVHLRITLADDQCILDSSVKRVFPLSDPRQYLSIQDGKGDEIAILTTMDGLDQPTRQLIEEALDRRYFTPRIERIDVLKQEAGMWRFAVQTQRGSAEFYVRNWRDSAFEITPGRWQIHSVDGARFEIPKLEGLDEKSQRLIEQLL